MTTEPRQVYGIHAESLRNALNDPESTEARLHWPRLVKLLPDKAEHILDHGCGTGVYTEELAALYPWSAVVGVDREPSMLPNDGMALYVSADIDREAGAAVGPYDLIVSKMVAHYEHDLKGLAGALIRRLRPGGTLVVSVPHPDDSIKFIADRERSNDETTIEREIASSGIWAVMWHRSMAAWSAPFTELLIDNPSQAFEPYDYHIVHDSIADGLYDKRYNFALVPGWQAANEIYERLGRDGLIR